MLTQDYLETAVITNVDTQGYHIQQGSSTSEVIQVGIWQDHLAYTGSYGNALIRLNQVKDVLSIFGPQSNDEYILSKVVTSDMADDETRKAMMCDVIRHLAANR